MTHDGIMTGTTQPTRPGTGTRERLRRAPVESGLGMAPDPSSTPERVVVRAPLHDGVRTADGRVLPVLPALLADAGLGYLVFSTARLTAGAPTVDLRLDVAGVPAPDARWLRAELTLLHLDDEVGVGRAEMCDDTGAAVAAQSAHPGAVDARPLSTTVEFLRPVQVTDRLRARTVAIRDGRRFRTLGTELLLPDGRTAVRAVGTALRR